MPVEEAAEVHGKLVEYRSYETGVAIEAVAQRRTRDPTVQLEAAWTSIRPRCTGRGSRAARTS